MQNAKKTVSKLRLFTIFSLLVNIAFIAFFVNDQYGKKIAKEVFHRTKADQHKKVIMFGSSLTLDGNWEKLLSRSDVKNEGMAGFTTSHFVWLTNTSVVEYKPKICFIEVSINDLGVGIPITRTLKNIETIIDTLRIYQIIPVLSLTTYTSMDSLKNKMVDSLNSLIIGLAKQKNVEYFSLNESLSEKGFLKPEYTLDGIHFSEKAYPFWANKVKKYLAKHKI